MGSIQNEDHMQKPPPFHLTEVDRQILAQTDDEFVYHDWEELSGIIGKYQTCCYYWEQKHAKRRLLFLIPCYKTNIIPSN
jgi:hypothetical protein